LNDPAATQESSAVRRLRLAACASTVLLLAPVVHWTLIAPTIARVVAGAVLTLPLVVGLPFLYSRRRRSYAWMTLALAPSLVLGLTEVVANPAMRSWAALLLFGVLVVFALLVAYLRATRSSSLPSQTAQ
jgi:uncharacterized membrane protein